MWRCSALILALALAGCERYPSGGDLRIRRDMVDQPSFRPQRDPRLPAEGTTPKTGLEPPMTRDVAMRDLKNLLPASAESRALYQVYCGHCHGDAGRGDGPVAAKIAKPADLAQKRSDGLIYYTIRYGTPVMPALAEALTPNERWQIVNFVRRFQQP